MSLEKRKNRIGRVVSDKMDKTVIVAVQRQRNHYLYKKPVRMTSKFYAHDGRNECSVGDLVKIEECRPLSALKRWRVTGILERRDVVEVAGMVSPHEGLEDRSGGDYEADREGLEVEDPGRPVVATAGGDLPGADFCLWHASQRSNRIASSNAAIECAR